MTLPLNSVTSGCFQAGEAAAGPDRGPLQKRSGFPWRWRGRGLGAGNADPSQQGGAGDWPRRRHHQTAAGRFTSQVQINGGALAQGSDVTARGETNMTADMVPLTVGSADRHVSKSLNFR